jgi:1,4-dihydroxy-6-naphthoate synthase
MKLSLGFSPCPNDTFIFDALVNDKIDTGELSFDVILEDVETLNQWALKGKLDITKLSYGVLPLVLDRYILLNSGSALGKGVGPLLIQNSKFKIQNIEDFPVAIPGEHTTAHLLFSLAYPNAKNKVFIRYDEIENFVLTGKGLGVIIHENRFTYEAKGLHKITDLGDYWEKTTSSSIPLGGIAAKRSLNNSINNQVDRLIRKSVEYAYKHHYAELTDYVKNHSQEMSEEVMRKHIDLYVNNFSINLGEEGRNSIETLLNIYQNTNGYSPLHQNKIFLSAP